MLPASVLIDGARIVRVTILASSKILVLGVEVCRPC